MGQNDKFGSYIKCYHFNKVSLDMKHYNIVPDSWTTVNLETQTLIFFSQCHMLLHQNDKFVILYNVNFPWLYYKYGKAVHDVDLSQNLTSLSQIRPQY